MISFCLAILTTSSLSAAQLFGGSDAYDSYVDTSYQYTGPDVPIGDWNDQTINGNGRGYPRLTEPPAVQPSSEDVTNNVNVISLSYLPDGMHIHYQTPFGLGRDPSVHWGQTPDNLDHTSIGTSRTYERTPPCSLRPVTQCSEFFHEVQLTGLEPDKTYYYKIPSANGTTESQTLKFKTARAAGNNGRFTAAVLNDMGYKNAKSTHKYLSQSLSGDDPISFAWHGGDISYADNWGSSPGGDMSVMYESNWDIWQQWMSNITSSIAYMVMPGNHEVTCTEGDGKNHILTPYLNENETNTTAPKSELTYYSCPVSQRNFTSYQHRFRMPGEETSGVSNFWYSFDYGLAHFISLDGETDFPNSPESTFSADDSSGKPSKDETVVMNSGPFGYINGSYKSNQAYEQYNWLKNDLASINRTRTPWVFVNCHRPMYAGYNTGYEEHMRNAFEDLLLEYGVDVFYGGHIHWYERTYPLKSNGKIDQKSVKDDNTVFINEGQSITHIVNGMAGNVENHSHLPKGQNSPLDIVAMHDETNFGFSKLTVFNESVAYSEFVGGEEGTVLDYVWFIRSSDNEDNSSATTRSSSKTSSTLGGASSTAQISTLSPDHKNVSSQGSIRATTPSSSHNSIPTTGNSIGATSNSNLMNQPSSTVDKATTRKFAESISRATSRGASTPSGLSTTGKQLRSSSHNSQSKRSGISIETPLTSSVITQPTTVAATTRTGAENSETSSEERNTSSESFVKKPVTEYTTVVSEYTTFCPSATKFSVNGKTYTATEATSITIQDCPCTLTLNAWNTKLSQRESATHTGNDYKTQIDAISQSQSTASETTKRRYPINSVTTNTSVIANDSAALLNTNGCGLSVINTGATFFGILCLLM